MNMNIKNQHRKEWEDSAISNSLINHNLKSVDGDEAFEYLVYAIKDRRNDGRLRDNVLNAYKHIHSGGWWCSGVDPQTGDRLDWGCLKPDTPRNTSSLCKPNSSHPSTGEPVKLIKYEHPPQERTRLFALRVPYEVGQTIADRFGLSEEYQARSVGKSPADADRHFWEWAIEKKQIPLLVTEGAKKGAALLSNGYLAVALPGIWGAYRQDKDEMGAKKGSPYLIEDIKPLIKDRDVVFVFDQENKPKTRYNVVMAQKKTSELMADAGSQQVSAIRWDLKHLPQKGVDDLIAAHGSEVFDRLFEQDRDRVRSLPVATKPIDYLVTDQAHVWRKGEEFLVSNKDLDSFIFESNLQDAKPAIIPESTIYLQMPKGQELQNLPPPTLTIESMNYKCYCWKIHGADARELQKLQNDLTTTTGTKPVLGVPLPKTIDMFSGYKAQAIDITAKSYSLEYLRESVPDHSPTVTPTPSKPVLREQQQQLEEISR
jgi:Domain of unknown function (DUF3854)